MRGTAKTPAGGTTVVNRKGHRDDPAFAGVIYVGRVMRRGGWNLPGSPWASPFRIGRDATRTEVIAKYWAWIMQQGDLLAMLPQVPGRRLGCWCAPEPCHADVLAELADSESKRDGAASQPI